MTEFNCNIIRFNAIDGNEWIVLIGKKLFYVKSDQDTFYIHSSINKGIITKDKEGYNLSVIDKQGKKQIYNGIDRFEKGELKQEILKDIRFKKILEQLKNQI